MSGLSQARRVIVGFDEHGRSTVTADEAVHARVERPSGAVVQEIWRQANIPARPGDDGGGAGEMAALPPPAGASVRLFTLPPDARVDEGTTGAIGTPLGRTPSLYIATVVSGRAYLLLETSEVLLREGDSMVLPGGLHAWRNPFSCEAVMVTCVFPLAQG